MCTFPGSNLKGFYMSPFHFVQSERSENVAKCRSSQSETFSDRGNKLLIVADSGDGC